MSYTYPIFKKHTQLGDGDTNGIIYMEFVSECEAICLKIDGTRPAYNLGVKNSTCHHNDSIWDDWDGNINIQLKTYKIRKD